MTRRIMVGNVLHHDFIAAKAGTPHLILIQKNG